MRTWRKTAYSILLPGGWDDSIRGQPAVPITLSQQREATTPYLRRWQYPRHTTSTLGGQSFNITRNLLMNVVSSL